MKEITITVGGVDYVIRCENDPGRIDVEMQRPNVITITDMSSGQPVQRTVYRDKFENGVLEDVK